MKPATEPTRTFAHSNPFALALLGIEARARAVDQVLPRDRPPQVHDEQMLEARASHPLDLALLGLLSLGERIAQLGDADPAQAQINEPAPPPTDMLR